MVNPTLLQQVSELYLVSQPELIDCLYGMIDDGTLDAETVKLLDERLLRTRSLNFELCGCDVLGRHPRQC